MSTTLRIFSPSASARLRASLNPRLPCYYELIYILALTRVGIGPGGFGGLDASSIRRPDAASDKMAMARQSDGFWMVFRENSTPEIHSDCHRSDGTEWEITWLHSRVKLPIDKNGAMRHLGPLDLGNGKERIVYIGSDCAHW